jgi:hypothetical protein
VTDRLIESKSGEFFVPDSRRRVMEEPTAELHSAFEKEGYEVDEVSTNRSQVRMSIRDPEASGEILRKLTYSVLEESDVLGFNVTTGSTANDDINTVVTFRYRG